MLDIALTGYEGKEEHSVTAQWEPSATDASKGMFRVNNFASTGGSKLFSREDFASRKIFAVDPRYAVVIARPR